MNANDFRRFFDDDFDNQGGDAGRSPLRTYFPAAVVERLRASSVPPPVPFSQYLKRLETEPGLEESFTLDLFRLLADEEGFAWPLDDLGRCIALRQNEDQHKVLQLPRMSLPEFRADQQDKAKSIIDKHVADLEAVKNDAALDKAGKKAKVVELRQQYVTDINGILTPDQQKKWTASREANKAKVKAHVKQRAAQKTSQ